MDSDFEDSKSEVERSKTRLVHLLENQDLLEARLLLKKVKALDDVSGIVSTQWVPLTSNSHNPAFSSVMGLFTSEKTVGYGSVLLHEPSVENLLLLTQWLTRDTLVTVNARIDCDPPKKIRLVVQKNATLDEVSLAIKNAVDLMGMRDANLVAHSALWVSPFTFKTL